MRKTFGPIGTLAFWLVVALMIAIGTDLNALSATKKPAGKAQNEAAQIPKDTNPQNTIAASTDACPTGDGNASSQGGTGAGQTGGGGGGGMDMSSMMKNMGGMMNMCPMMRRQGSANFGPVQNGYDIVDAKDYRAFDLEEARPELCQAACGSDDRCKAYTYTKPGTYGNPKARCWLKETQGRFVAHENAISAVKK